MKNHKISSKREKSLCWMVTPGVLEMLKKKKTTKKEKKKGNNATETSKKAKKRDKGGKTIEEDFTTSTVTMQPPNTTTTSAAPQQPSHPVVEQWVQRALDMGVANLRLEFVKNAKYTRANITQNAFNANQNGDITLSKNRYADVPCQDQNIVTLASPPSPCSYIHANYVGCPMVPEKRFICTQGPLDHTIDEFWWMIVQEKVEQIVMLCKTIETGKYKCAQYWPVNAGEMLPLKSGLIIENLTGAKPLERDGEIFVTNLQIHVPSPGGATKIPVRHLHWSAWPDRGVPPCKLTSLELLSAVRGSKMPIVVHCSAGIGRTGTIVAIEYILEKIASNSSCPPMIDLVKELRDQRAYSIQTDLQYLYIHRVMLDYFLNKYKEKYGGILTQDNIAKFNLFIAHYDQAVK